MKLEDLLKAIIDGNYPKKFKLDTGVCNNARALCSPKDFDRLLQAIHTLYYNKLFPVFGADEYFQSQLTGDMYTEGFRAIFCREILNELKRPKWKFWTKPKKKHFVMEALTDYRGR